MQARSHQVAFSSAQNAVGEIFVRPSSGQGAAKLLFTADAQIELTDWSNDGHLIFFDRLDPRDANWDIWTLDLQTLDAGPLLSGSQDQKGAYLSPDGKWLAFSSDESGRPEIYVQSFPGDAGRWMVSSDAEPSPASQPAWRDDGRELYYLRGGAVVAIPVIGDTHVSFGSPRSLFRMSIITSSKDYAVSRDGQRILTNELPPADRSKVGATLIQNWTAALAR